MWHCATADKGNATGEFYITINVVQLCCKTVAGSVSSGSCKNEGVTATPSRYWLPCLVQSRQWGLLLVAQTQCAQGARRFAAPSHPGLGLHGAKLVTTSSREETAYTSDRGKDQTCSKGSSSEKKHRFAWSPPPLSSARLWENKKANRPPPSTGSYAITWNVEKGYITNLRPHDLSRFVSLFL